MTSHHSLSVFALYEAGGASADDYFNIIVDSAGATRIGTIAIKTPSIFIATAKKNLVILLRAAL